MSHRLPSPPFSTIALGALLLGAAGCGLSPEQAAQQAYFGLDLSVDKAVDLSLAGMNAATSAQIPDQTALGAWTGTMLVRGKVEAPSAAERTLSTIFGMREYCDDGKDTYDTDPAALPAVSMQLQGLPGGTFKGTLKGQLAVSNALSGPVELDLAFQGDLEAIGSAGAARIEGTMHLTGTSRFGGASYAVDITR